MKKQYYHTLKMNSTQEDKKQKTLRILSKKHSPGLIAVKSFLKTKSFFFQNFKSDLKKKENFYIHIKCSQNNIFCTLLDVFSKKVIFSSSSGKYGVNISRKNLRYNVKPVLTYFFREIKEKISFAKTLIVIFTLPINLKKIILSFVFSQLYDKTKNKSIFFIINNKKCFNGCKSRKVKRKKHRFTRFLNV